MEPDEGLRRRRMLRKLREILGREEADTLMGEIRPPDDLTELKQDVAVLKEDVSVLKEDVREMKTEMKLIRKDMKLSEARMDAKLSDLKASLLETINEQTKSLFKTAVVSNAASVLAVAVLAFGAAKLA